jgi:hypothetical protein
MALRKGPASATSGRLATPGEPAPGARVGESGDWVGLFGGDEFDCAEPFEWPVDEEDLEREVGLNVSL